MDAERDREIKTEKKQKEKKKDRHRKRERERETERQRERKKESDLLRRAFSTTPDIEHDKSGEEDGRSRGEEEGG